MMAVKNKNTISPEKSFTHSGKLGGTIKDRIKSTLDNELKIKKFVRDDPKKIDLFVIGIFQRIFVEILNFNLVRGTFFGVAESISVTDWNRQAGAEEAYVIAEKEDFRILYVRLKRLTRTAQRYAVSSLISKKWTRTGEFIAIFYEEGSDIWHLVSPHLTEGRNILRRYIVGMGEKHRTVSENLAKMDATIPEPLFGRIQEAFKLEPVTEEFYEEYKQNFGNLKDHLVSLGINIRDSKRYSHLFLNRLMFIYFIQKKGWIGGNKEFTKWYLESYRTFGEKNRLHEKWLNTLFFNAMNKSPREKKFSSGFPSEVCEVLNGIPYLNGGLFEKDTVDELGIELPDSLVIEIVEDFLEDYNFTITEESPFDIDIAVDPAMLGKIYESLIAEEERGKSGIFYTPRIEVDFMCRLALYENLIQQRTDQVLTLEDTLINRLLGNVKVIELLFTPPEEWKEDPKEFSILKKFLDKLKIVDPACGSGAFLVGMLNILQELYHKMGIKSDYNLKENIINNNLYGVDIKDWAVRMAEFRLWLALVESEDQIPDTEPVLPNFFFKLRVGDSIVQKVGEDFIKLEMIKGKLEKDTRESLDKLEAIKDRYFRGEKGILNEIKETQLSFLDKYIEMRISVLQEKKTQQITLKGERTDQAQINKREIENKIASLRKTKEYLKETGGKKIFVWDLDFPEIMLKGGFDIVIANPPYVRLQEIIRQDLDPEELESYSDKQIKELKNKYKKDLVEYVNQTYSMNVGKRCDLYVYFFFKGFELLNSKGVMVYISSNSWLDVGYGKHLQEALLKEMDLRYVIDNSAKRSFEESDINTIISIIGKSQKSGYPSRETDFVVFKSPYENVRPSIMKNALLKKDITFVKTHLNEEPLSISTQENLRILFLSCQSLWRLGGGKTEEAQKTLNPQEVYGSVVLSGKYSGDKWGKYLRAPDIFFIAVERNQKKIICARETDYIDIFLGITTGKDSYFYLDEGKIQESSIEHRFLKPIIKSPTECSKYRVTKKDSSLSVLHVPFPKSSLRKTHVLRYIEQGERMGVPDGTFFNNIKLEKWYRHSSIINSKKVDLISPYQPYLRHFTAKLNGDLLVHKQLVGIKINKVDYEPMVFGYLNSTFGVLVKELWSRINFGQGSIQTSVEDHKDMPILAFDAVTNSQLESLIKIVAIFENQEIKSVFEEIGAEEPENFSLDKVRPERRKLDEIIMGEILDLTEEEQKEIYKGLIRLVKNRIEKAESV